MNLRQLISRLRRCPGCNAIFINDLVTQGTSCLQTRHHTRHISHSTRLTRDQIRQHTEVSRDHLTPEVALCLITQNCDLWHSTYDNGPFNDPFWAFYWPGGQALTRYLLDNRKLFAGKTVLDVGSGCGASSIACKMAGAKRVIANDIDPVALEAISLNADINHVTLEYSSSNVIGQHGSWDIVLLGDMFYDEYVADVISVWLDSLVQQEKHIYIGDPGRLPFTKSRLKSRLTLQCQYDLSDTCLRENFGQSTGYVWQYDSKH